MYGDVVFSYFYGCLRQFGKSLARFPAKLSAMLFLVTGQGATYSSETFPTTHPAEQQYARVP
jgi:hypothetical protein